MTPDDLKYGQTFAALKRQPECMGDSFEFWGDMGFSRYHNKVWDLSG
jgi:hypothetical protein